MEKIGLFVLICVLGSCVSQISKISNVIFNEKRKHWFYCQQTASVSILDHVNKMENRVLSLLGGVDTTIQEIIKGAKHLTDEFVLESDKYHDLFITYVSFKYKTAVFLAYLQLFFSIIDFLFLFFFSNTGPGIDCGKWNIGPK